MYTVFIAEKSVIDSVRENKLFFSQYLKTKEVGFCQWDPEQANPADAVINLANVISNHSRWRAVVVCGKENILAHNPFDVVGYKEDATQLPVRDKQQTYGEYLAKRREYFLTRRAERLAAYEQGAQQPLARLMTYLCEAPIVAEGLNQAASRADTVQARLGKIGTDEESAGELDIVFADVRGEYDEFAEYQEEMRFKEQLRQKILEDAPRNFTLPAEVICIARRCYNSEQSALNAVWKPHNEEEYSSFYKYNMYFDRMRYLIYDILPECHAKYNQSYLEFLFTCLMIACNDLPQGCLQANRVFRLDCQVDASALSQAVSAYHGKLEATIEMLSREIAQNKSECKEGMTDGECEARFQEQVSINMPTMEDFDMPSLYLNCRALGMTYDCPEEESSKWKRERRSTQDALGRYLKRPSRSLKLAAEDMHVMSNVDVSDAPKMNSFQIESMEQYVADAEMSMARMQTAHLEDHETFKKRFEEPGAVIEKANATRLPKKPAIILGICMILVYLVGFLPFVFSNIRSAKALIGTVLICLVAAAVIFGAMLLCLLFTRMKHADKWRGYNDVMHGVVGEVEGYLDGYSQYLSHMCAAIRGHRVLSYAANYEEPYNSKNRILKKHISQLIEQRSEIEDLLGDLIDCKNHKAAEPYDYDFSRPVNYEYPLFTGKTECTMEFLQTGVSVQVPLLLMRSVKVVREELYE